MYLGDFTIGSIVYIPPFTTNDGSGGAVAPSTAFEAADVAIFKNLSATEKTSVNGLTLTSPFNATTGLHTLAIDTGNATGDVGFWVSGADYAVVLTPDETVDSQTVVRTIGDFSIDNRRVAGELISTTIATLASQVSFTLTAGSADNDAYNGCMVIVRDSITLNQVAVGLVEDYVGSTKTVTLAIDPGIFTMAALDNITIQAGAAAVDKDIEYDTGVNKQKMMARIYSWAMGKSPTGKEYMDPTNTYNRVAAPTATGGTRPDQPAFIDTDLPR